MNGTDRHSILLGGIGGDSHSVGLTILRHALEDRYRVMYLGPQSDLERFVQFSIISNVVMVSCMDGHAKKYLLEFPKLEQKYKVRSCGTKWYLGGNLTIGNSIAQEKIFLELGFDRVFPKFVDVRVVLELLEMDLADCKFATDPFQMWETSRSLPFQPLSRNLSEGKLEEDDFHKLRKDVLESWRTGAGARDLFQNAEFLGRQSSFPEIQSEVNHGKSSMLVQPRTGVALIEPQIQLFSALKRHGASVLSYQVDSYTRNNNYIAAEEGIRESRVSGISVMNGFPVVNHGVDALRRIISQVKMPLQTRHSTRSPELLAEISFAGGVTAYEGGSISYNIPYYKDYPLSESITAWQYVDRLAGLYHEKFSIVLDREFFGTLTATLIPPSLAIVTGILESILAVQQGVKCVSIGYAEQGNRIQDIAAIAVMRQMASEIFGNLGYKDVQINTVFHQYMAAFPPFPHMAQELIYQSAITAALSGATRLLTKTPVEAFHIPDLADNIEGLQLVLRGISDAQNERIDESKIIEESRLIRSEVQSIFESVLMCGHGNIASGIVNAFKKGYIDIPFAPSIYNHGKAITARDGDGAVRFLKVGNLQFGRDLKEFHENKMQERFRLEGLTLHRHDHILVERDVLQIARGQYESWPLTK